MLRRIQNEDRTHLLTVAVEDYFHATTLNPLIPERHKSRMERRVVDNTLRALDLLDRHKQRATFFVLGQVAELEPALVRTIFERGHEVACKGYERKEFGKHTPDSFRHDAQQAKAAVERALGRVALGYRVSEGHIGPDDEWALDVLAEVGFEYDSSVYPRSIGVRSQKRFPFTHAGSHGSIQEFPLSSMGYGGVVVPMAGGNYFRQLPEPLTQGAFWFWHVRYTSPFNMYFHVWELDPELPRIATATALKQVRQYRNIERMPEIIGHYLQRYRFTGIADYQRHVQEPLASDPPPPRISTPPALEPADERTPISIVIPCFNESKVLGYLDNALEEVSRIFAPRCDVSFVLVDDCSTDETWSLMQQRFGERPNVRLEHHEVNKGVAGAIMTGIRAAKTEIVCSMDADCTYDPRQLHELIEKLDADVAMVTASPYHSEGHVVGVPEWRLFLSRNLSRMYGQVLNHKFAMYTSCFRAYRRSKMEPVQLDNTGFLGVAEMLIRLDVAGEKIVECPATLEARLLGTSKLKTANTVVEHLKMLSRIPAMKAASKP